MSTSVLHSLRLGSGTPTMLHVLWKGPSGLVVQRGPSGRLSLPAPLACSRTPNQTPCCGMMPNQSMACLQGTDLMKHGRHGKPKVHYFRLAENDTHLTWRSAKGNQRGVSLTMVKQVTAPTACRGWGLVLGGGGVEGADIRTREGSA